VRHTANNASAYLIWEMCAFGNLLTLGRSQEAAMRNLIAISSAIALAITLASFAPKAWTNSAAVEATFTTVSPYDLTTASGPLDTSEYADSH
jgi:hypothetical protein